ncbi:UDP-glucose/GDP-mannose dehydrogenase family protein [Paenibacillus sp. PL2-23]|uniref:UDP-glucose dehydrogenase family protein n=1 Tax=Paenibacillus sp. PL2-23 TaxID=2100729 RepID=UPI0030F9CACB
MITIIGTGYVGLITGLCFAQMGKRVTCVDLDADRIQSLNKMKSPFYEPGVQELIESLSQKSLIRFTTDITSSIEEASIIFITTGTPSLPDGSADLTYLMKAIDSVLDGVNGPKKLVLKSTIPIGTTRSIKRYIDKRGFSDNITLYFIPEFLREGSALQDVMHPDRVVIGTVSGEPCPTMMELHGQLTQNIITTSYNNAEAIKYCANAFLATRISFINELANICDKLGADIDVVVAGVKDDRRIGSLFFNAGIGYGGSCFPKDMSALVAMAKQVGYESRLLNAVIEVNQLQVDVFVEKIFREVPDDGMIGIWGVSFKPNTDDVRMAPSLRIVQKLLDRGMTVKVYDPRALNNFRKLIDHPRIQWCQDAMEAAIGCDAICILTEWDEFKRIDLSMLGGIMNRRFGKVLLFDGRNTYSKNLIDQRVMKYIAIGRRTEPSIWSEDDEVQPFQILKESI